MGVLCYEFPWLEMMISTAILSLMRPVKKIISTLLQAMTVN